MCIRDRAEGWKRCGQNPVRRKRRAGRLHGQRQRKLFLCEELTEMCIRDRVRMADASQPSNAISILYNGSYIEKLIDGVGREYRFTYKDATLSLIHIWLTDWLCRFLLFFGNCGILARWR